jgi:hypothetical protein
LKDNIVTNPVNTNIDQDLLKMLSKEERDMLMEYISAIPFVQNMIALDRPYAKELTRWEDPNNDEQEAPRVKDPKNGRIRVEFSNPHVLEDMNYFRQAAIHFEEHGKYTFLKPSRNPFSDYKLYWDEEIRRCWDGYTRESDGEWITGYFYFYLNYAPIMKSKKRKNSRRADRIQGLPDFYDGDYLFFHYLDRARDNGSHTVTLKKRGAGYSLKGGGKMGRNFILGESSDAKRNVVSLAIANEKEYLTKDGILNKFVDVIDFCAEHTPFPAIRELKNSWINMHWMMGYKEKDTGIEKGTHNQVIGVTLNNDHEKARGKRAVLIEWEEFGKFDNSIKAWNIGRPSVEEEGGYVFGLMNAYGTGGTEGAAFAGLRELFYNPGGYNVYPLQNVYDKHSKTSNKCGFFHASYLNMKGRMDESGNSDVVASLVTIIKNRIHIKYNSKETSTITQTIAENPITPQEAIMKSTGSTFDTVEIRDYLEECRVNEDKFVSGHLVGDLVIKSDGKVEFKTNFDKTPIRKYNSDKTNLEGAIEIFTLPKIDLSIGKPFQYRYIAGIDPVDSDYVSNGSLASIFIFDLWTDEIVAEYTGRPDLAEEFYEICRRLLIFYNAIGNYENNIKGLFGYFNGKNSLYLLCDTPQYLKDSEQSKQTPMGNQSKGTRTTSFVIADGKRLQKSWHRSLSEHVDSNGETIKTPQLRKIRSLGYLEEIYEYHIDGNFDRVSAMDMVMILRQERLRLTESRDKNEKEEEYIEEDEFVRDNYGEPSREDSIEDFESNYK